ncbi:LrgB family protein [uncultured Sunxiuqinia sp.]|uniref:LrgB family protein n=1 Tax=Sunxiuqinia rutila TaxID=1397841 RepID=UPI00261ED4D8|nr:LrgB family protein [uncultured Sunxiuqinia sp.]
MKFLTDTHLFGILLSVASFYGISYLRDKLKATWLNPLMSSIALIIGLLLLFDIPFEHFMEGGSVIHSFLGPVTVVLALPLYRNRKLLKAHKFAIMGGITAGVFAAVASVILLGRLFQLNELLERSIMGHSVTTPIGIGISDSLGANEGITVLSIMITGIFGVIIAPSLYRLLRIVHPVAKGIGLGTSAHALGTTKAMEMGETEGAMSSLAIGVTALTTVLVVIILQVLGWY